MEFTLQKNWKKGLGTELGVLCTLMDYGVTQLNINCELNNTNFEKYKKIFNIPDNRLKINHTSELTNEMEPSDLFKALSPYYKIPNLKSDKKFIGIASYQDNTVLETPKNTYPENKLYSITEYANLYKFLKRNGWDVITLDSKDIPLETKAALISDLCECVIGYEGGMAHLCHMLNVPYIMFPWKTPFNSKLMHLDEKTFFLNSFDQILSWSKEDLDKCISNLHNSITNNEFVNNRQLVTAHLSKHPISRKEKEFLATK